MKYYSFFSPYFFSSLFASSRTTLRTHVNVCKIKTVLSDCWLSDAKTIWQERYGYKGKQTEAEICCCCTSCTFRLAVLPYKRNNLFLISSSAADSFSRYD